MKLNDYTFRSATPIWEVGTSKVMNRTLSFCANVAGGQAAKVAAAASCGFVLLVNGEFVAHGPARCAHGHFRVDEYDLTPYLTQAVNRVTLRVAGYNVNAFSYLNQPSFLCVEILSGDEVLAATGGDGFTCYATAERIIKTQRYSFQRTFTEAYELSEGAFDYEINPDTKAEPVATEAAAAGRFICRDMPYSDNEIILPRKVFQRGTVTYSDKDSYYQARELVPADIYFTYPDSELECASHIEVGKCDCSAPAPVDESADVIDLAADSYVDLDLGVNYTGVYDLTMETEGDGTLYILFDEILLDGHVTPHRLFSSQIITVRAGAGKYHLTCAEPYTMRYVRLIAKGCAMKVNDLKIYHIAYPATQITAEFVGDDATMKMIYDAAVETFRANTVDIYMDCPSRERAGWLCDSFFTSRVEKTLTGKSLVERAFLENFLMPESFEFLPEGMLPMCYPADHNDRTFIPNWAMWYVVELGEYLARTGDAELIASAKERVYGLLDYFTKLENEFGLLEKLESWVFVEWSKSNELTQDVSFASNMLYCTMLDIAADLYADSALKDKATALRNTINEMSMTESGFYCDNAYRVDGKLVLSGERTESCQYYAFFTGVATPETHPELWNILVHDFGYDRAEKGLYPEIWPANAFIGNYLRLDLLARHGFKEELYDNIKGYFAYMAERTGTLWELTASQASCDHGFASHVLYWMDSLGLLSHR